MSLWQRGSQGSEVAKSQTRLREIGLYAGPIDGDYDGGTESAVKARWAAIKQCLEGDRAG
jgi:peptidoglycan hydrolase-like protein with peptidoglycan-binding domain